MQKNSRLVAILVIATGILLIPLACSFLTDEVKWSRSDYLAAAILLYGTGSGVELVLRAVKTKFARLSLVGGLLIVLALTWAELAVGIFGTPFAGS